MACIVLKAAAKFEHTVSTFNDIQEGLWKLGFRRKQTGLDGGNASRADVKQADFVQYQAWGDVLSGLKSRQTHVCVPYVC